MIMQFFYHGAVHMIIFHIFIGKLLFLNTLIKDHFLKRILKHAYTCINMQIQAYVLLQHIILEIIICESNRLSRLQALFFVFLAVK